MLTSGAMRRSMSSNVLIWLSLPVRSISRPTELPSPTLVTPDFPGIFARVLPANGLPRPVFGSRSMWLESSKIRVIPRFLQVRV